MAIAQPKWVKVSDETTDPKVFHGLLMDNAPRAGSDDKVWVFVAITNAENGFNQPIGWVPLHLKHLGSGKYGA